VKFSTQPSDEVLAQLAKLPKPWKWGDDICNHFEIIDADDAANAKLMQDLAIKKSELPLLVKECDPTQRKPAVGLKTTDLARTWNQWFAEPKPSPKSETGPCVPKLGANGKTAWTWPGSLREHLIDPRGPHHLPPAVVDRWTFAEQQRFHNWHHDAMQASAVKRQGAVKAQPRIYQAGTREGTVERRAWQIAASVPRTARPSFDSSVSPKKETRNCASGRTANAAA
jgi:hypothetical protein